MYQPFALSFTGCYYRNFPGISNAEMDSWKIHAKLADGKFTAEDVEKRGEEGLCETTDGWGIDVPFVLKQYLLGIFSVFFSVCSVSPW